MAARDQPKGCAGKGQEQNDNACFHDLSLQSKRLNTNRMLESGMQRQCLEPAEAYIDRVKMARQRAKTRLAAGRAAGLHQGSALLGHTQSLAEPVRPN